MPDMVPIYMILLREFRSEKPEVFYNNSTAVYYFDKIPLGKIKEYQRKCKMRPLIRFIALKWFQNFVREVDDSAVKLLRGSCWNIDRNLAHKRDLQANNFSILGRFSGNSWFLVLTHF